jgi:hypothetical protein
VALSAGLLGRNVAMNRGTIGKVRSTKGQGLIEGVCGSLIVVLVFVGLIMLSLNVFATVVYSQKIQFIADTAARVYNERHFWLGTIRPDFDETEAQRKATETATKLLEKLALPPLTSISFSPEVTEEGLAFATVKLTVGGLRLPYGGKIFPSLISLSTVAYSAEAAATPYASYVLRVPAAGTVDANGLSRTDQYEVGFLPAFGFARDRDAFRPLGINGIPTTVGFAGAVVREGKYA